MFRHGQNMRIDLGKGECGAGWRWEKREITVTIIAETIKVNTFLKIKINKKLNKVYSLTTSQISRTDI